jgi:ankyrin repeat protein
MMLISGSLEANSSHDIVLFEERVASNHQQRVTAELARLSNAALEENNKNDLPLHLAMRNVHMERNDDGHKGVSDGILDALLSLNRDAVKHLNADGCLPLHIACQAAMDEQTIIRLVKVYPESVMIQCNLDIQFSKNEFAQDKEGRDDDSIFLDWSLDTCIKTCLGACMLCDEMNEKDDQAFKTFESALSPLHLAVLNSASPNIIDHILNANPMCLRLKSSQGRTALDMAESMSNTDDTIQVMKSLISNTAKSRRLQKFSKSLLKLPVDNLAEKESFNAKMMWKKVGNAIIFTNRLMLALGPIVDVDNNDKFKISEDFEIPAGFERNCVDVILPIGFHQLRWAFTSHQSSFYKEFHEIEMDCTE